MILKDKIENIFTEKFGQNPSIFQSPGRINIIGEHTDYNEGFVLPAAVDKGIYVAIKPNNSSDINLFSVEYDELWKENIESIPQTGKKNWTDYILGVVCQLQKRNLPIKGFDLVIDGDIPIGSGMSSSAAVECATVFALNDLFELGLSRTEMVLIAQESEHEFVGVKCGIMDMFASMFGHKDHAIKLDCRTLEYEYFPLNLEGYKFLLLNTNVKHNLASSAYNERRQQCEQGAIWIQEHYPDVKTLRDVSLKQLNEIVLPKDALVYKRCCYIIEEIGRLSAACEVMQNNNFEELGKLLWATHEGLSNQYEVSCKELDLMISLVKNNPEVLGGRMMGGGFGGCTINLVKETAIDRIVNCVAPKYFEQTGKKLEYYIVSASSGTKKYN